MSNIKEKLKKGQNLSFEESKILFSELMEGKHDETFDNRYIRKSFSKR